MTRAPAGAARTLAAVVLTATALAMAGPAGAAETATIEVFPGANAITNALATANDGDTLNIHAGTYRENVDVLVPRVRLRAAGDGEVVVDGRCRGTTIDVEADGVRVQNLTVVGGDFFNLNYMFVGGGVVTGSTFTQTCAGAEYGINLYVTGPMQLVGNTASGFGDAGIYIGSIVDVGTRSIVARDNTLFDNNRGMIIEDSSRVAISALDNWAHDNVTDGIWVHRADGVLVQGNKVENNGFGGIDVTADSSHNTITANKARGHQFDLVNQGTNNCFTDNWYTTSQGPIGC